MAIPYDPLVNAGRLKTQKLMDTTQIQAILFDLGNTLSRSASLSGSLADIANTQVPVNLNLSVHQLLKIGVEIEQEIIELFGLPFSSSLWRSFRVPHQS